MRVFILSFALVLGAFITATAQTKGTNTIGLGFSYDRQEMDAGTTVQDSKSSGVSLGYGRFIKDNLRLGVNTQYYFTRHDFGSLETENRNFGGGVSLQKYYPVFKKFYAFAGGNVNYNRLKTSSEQPGFISETTGNNFGLGVSGGATYFLSKRFAFEADILSGGLSYSKNGNSESGSESTRHSLSLSTTGTITNLGFRVYILF